MKINLKHASAHVCVSFMPNGLDVHLKFTSIKIALGILALPGGFKRFPAQLFLMLEERLFLPFFVACL